MISHAIALIQRAPETFLKDAIGCAAIFLMLVVGLWLPAVT